jgi:hypothetical protein
MKIRTFQTYCKEIGIKPVSGYTNAGYVTGLMRERGYLTISRFVIIANIKSVKEQVTNSVRQNPYITDVVYYYYINKSDAEPIYYIHIFYKKEFP